MKDRKNFLDRLKAFFGDCSRQSFLQKLRNLFLDEKPVLYVNETDDWNRHVAKLKDISVISDYISQSKNMYGSANFTKFTKSVANSLNNIPNYVDKHFKKPSDISDDTGEELAEKTGKFVKEYIWDLLKGCHNGIKYSQGAEKNFYETFYERLEKYLSSICVYRKDIKVGMDIRVNAGLFETPFTRETSDKSRNGIIDEIEVAPHFIPYKNDDGEQDSLIIKGVCIAFGRA